MFHVLEINSIETLRKYRLAWNELHARSKNPSFTRSFSWFENYWATQSDGQKLKVLLVSVMNKPIGFLPFVIKPYYSPIGKVRALTYPLDSWGFHFGPVGPNAAATLSGGMRYLKQSKRDWDMIDLRYIDREEEDKLRTPNAFRTASLSVIERAWRTHSVVDLTKKGTSLWSLLPTESKTRYTNSRTVLSSNQNSIEYFRYRSGDTSLHESNIATLFQEGADFVTHVAGSQIGKFISQNAEASRQLGMCDFNIVRINQKPVAVLLNEKTMHGEIHCSKLFVEESQRSDLSNFLLGQMLLDGFKRNDSRYLLPFIVAKRSESNLLANWQNSRRTSFRYTHFASLAFKSQAMKWHYRIKKTVLSGTGIAVRPRIQQQSTTTPQFKKPRPEDSKQASGQQNPEQTSLRLFTPQ